MTVASAPTMTTIETYKNVQYRILKEGQAKILFPMEDEVFYNPVQQFNRDMSIAAIKTWALSTKTNAKWQKKIAMLKRSQPENANDVEKVRILEALSASGLRSVRYAKEMRDILDHIVANDLSPEAVDSIQRNVEYNEVCDLVRPHIGDACDVMYQHRDISKRFHVVDLDPYGTAAPFLDGAIQCVEDGGLLCITCTDLGVLCGKYPETCFVKYGGVALKSDYCHEMALRLVLHSLQMTATKYKRKIIPLMSCSIDFYVRLFVKVETSNDGVRSAASNTSMVYQCSNCPSFKWNALGKMSTNEKGINKYSINRLEGIESTCDQCGSAIHIAGPCWSGPLHDSTFVQDFLKHVNNDSSKELYHTRERMLGMATVISEEINSMLYYKVDKLASAVKSSCPPLMKITSALLNGGYKASMSHCCANAIKTDAPNAAIWDIMREWGKISGAKIGKLPENSVAKKIYDSKTFSGMACVNFDEHPDCNPPSRKVKLVRFEEHKGMNWGPKARAKKRKRNDNNDDSIEQDNGVHVE